MTETDKPIPPEEYITIVKHVPVVSVDLLVHHEGGLVFGMRENEPAKGEWFVPGGTMLKGETRREAVHRIAQEEMDADVLIDEELGVYTHRYQSAAAAGVDSKQYLATAYVVTPDSDLQPDDQHTEFDVFKSPFPDLHNYVERYIRDLRRSGYRY